MYRSTLLIAALSLGGCTGGESDINNSDTDGRPRVSTLINDTMTPSQTNRAEGQSGGTRDDGREPSSEPSEPVSDSSAEQGGADRAGRVDGRTVDGAQAAQTTEGEDETSAGDLDQDGSAAEGVNEDGAPSMNETGQLSWARILTRASIDIRGRRPSLAELARLAAEPARLDDMIDEFLDDPGFADSVADLFSRALRNRSGAYQAVETEEGVVETETYQQSAADEPLMLIRHIVNQNLPYDEFLMADYTFANEDTAPLWRVTGYDAQSGGWQRVRYNDGRPMAGYLSMASTFMRFGNADANYNRGRANAMSRILLCDDFLKRPIDFPRDIDLSDDDVINHAIATNVACTSCHDQLDPMASFFAVYTEPDIELGEASIRYTPENADEWEDTTGKRPAFYGRNGDNIRDLARMIRSDVRFPRCAVTRVYEGLLDREAVVEDADAIRRHLSAFEEGGRTFKALYRSVITDPVYRGVAHEGRPATAAKMLSPERLQRVVTQLTGFQTKVEGVDLMRAERGLRVLGGGLSAFSGDYPARTANITRVLVQARLAEAASFYVVNQRGPKADALINDLDAPPTQAGIALLFRTILGRQPSDQEVTAFTELYSEITGDDAELELGHAALISVLLRDPEFLIY
ncbi:MAG: DUF1549 domain-containing protein [Myxococcota bacterium]|nr:DUF1549 domain-containing protein [Myxococcota bacterium]